jgi:biopolymer transport protein ExbB
MQPDSSLGFGHFIGNADALAKGILLLMLIASISSWYLIITKSISNWLASRRSKAFLEFFWNAPSLSVVASRLEQQHPDEPFSHLAYHGVIASRHHERHGIAKLQEAGTTGDFISRTLRRTIDEETARVESGLSMLASVGSTAPFVGLLGTVWGIYHALVAIGMSGAGTLDKVAGPVGEALIMTAIGLAVAIPAVLGYNYLVRSNRMMLARLDGFAHDLFTFLSTGVKYEARIDAQQSPNVAPLKPNLKGA